MVSLSGMQERVTRAPLRAVAALALLLCGGAAVAASGSAAIEQARGFLARLQGQPPAKEVFEVANTIGPVIDEVRQSQVSTADLETLRKLLEQMRQVTEKRLEAIEGETNENEAALERLYRSQVWDDMSFALAAFPYWRAWVDLELARRIEDRGLRTQALLPAEKGFRAASMQLFRPGLVYGGWLGLGYVELERGRNDRAMKIFENLDTALASEPDSPVREAVQLELRLLEAKSGQVKTDRRGRAIDATEARLLRVEAFALLQDSRKTGGRPLEAAERLRAIIEAGHIDQSLLSDMMIYAQELSGVDVGPYTDLAGAEFALQYEHYYNAMQKYEAFFKAVVPPRNLDLSYYRYRWAVAAYKAEIYQPAVTILEKLLREKNLPEDLDKNASKLLYAVYAAREQGGGSAANRKSLRQAAQRFVRKSPNDADADSARLMIAQTASNASTALQSLNQIQSSGKFKGDVQRTAYQIIARDFSNKIARSKIALAKGLAKDGIRAFQKLPKADKADPFNFAILLQMRALVDEQPEEVLKAIDFIEQKEQSNLDIKRALAWSRLQLYDRMGDNAKVAGFIAQTAAQGIASWQMEFLYPFIAEREDVAERLELARLAAPGAKDLPDMDRRFRALIVEDLLALGDAEAAFDTAREFTREHPTSGDAWQLLARAAEATEKPFEADQAWGVITNKAVPTMAIWWEGMLNRVRIRSHSTRPDQACSLLAEVDRAAEHMPAQYASDFEAARASAACGAARAAVDS